MVLYRCGLKPERAGEFSTSSNTHESDFKNNQIHGVKMRFSQSAGRILLEQWRDIFFCAGYCVFLCASAGGGGGGGGLSDRWVGHICFLLSPRVLELTSHKFNTALSTPAPLWFSVQYCLEQVTLKNKRKTTEVNLFSTTSLRIATRSDG